MARKTIGTGTAAFCVFDPEALAHRLVDSCDWWSIETDEIAEINDGNCLIFGTGYDGVFDVDIVKNESFSSPELETVIRAPSGKIYIGPGEDISGEDDQPEEKSEYYQGVFLEVEKGNYVVSVKKLDTTIHIAVSRTDKAARNQIARQLRLTENS